MGWIHWLGGNNGRITRFRWGWLGKVKLGLLGWAVGRTGRFRLYWLGWVYWLCVIDGGIRTFGLIWVGGLRRFR